MSILFNAIMKGVLFSFRIWITSAVWGLIPSLMSMTRTAKSAKEPPRFRRFVNAAWPGVSMNRNPGMLSFIPEVLIRGQAFFSCSSGYNVNEIFCVIPPASAFWTQLSLRQSRIEVFPWSTCPQTVTIGCLIFIEIKHGIKLKTF